MAKKKKQVQQKPQGQKDEAVTLKDQLGADVLAKLKLAKQSLTQKEQEEQEEKAAKAAFEKKQREKNMSFAELFEQYGNKGSKY